MDRTRTVLVVDDRKNTLKVLTLFLEDNGFKVLAAAGGIKALALYREHSEIELVLSDLKMPEMSGLELFRKMNRVRPCPPFIIMTAYASVQNAIKALKEGITDYLIKPLNFEELPIILDKSCRQADMSRELAVLRKKVSQENTFYGIIGASRPMRRLFQMVRTVGPTDASVLITGETGTGKELLAKSMHLESKRKEKAMVCINCAALAENLLEAELFGHVRGAFTGAVRDKMGLLEKADNGTLFLDEIGHMSLALQAKLLRFLQEKTFEPVGSTRSRRVDVRLVAATNADLSAQIKDGAFLRDLLYRIEVITLNAPPLRERPDDIPLLVEHFVAEYARRYQKPVEGVSGQAMQMLMDADWPGNVRELKNCLARAVILSPGPRISLRDISEKVQKAAGRETHASSQARERLPEGGITIKDMEAGLIEKTMKHCRGNKTLAAKMLGISRKGLYEKLARLEMRAEVHGS